MKIENLLFGVIGLLAGAIIGFVFANSLNRSAVELSAQSANTALASAARSSTARNGLRRFAGRQRYPPGDGRDREGAR
jgi:hypothetical protein